MGVQKNKDDIRDAEPENKSNTIIPAYILLDRELMNMLTLELLLPLSRFL